MNLTIAIPTYNRSHKLDESLQILFNLVKSSFFSNKITVYVSNNGSTDLSFDIIKKYKIIFQENNLSFHFNNFVKNEGFDRNIFKCYSDCTTEYIWLLSDDDLINKNVVNQIFNDILEYKPNIIYYNFDQIPYNSGNPYIKETNYFEKFEAKALKTIINWPKLSTIVLKKFDFINQSFDFNSGYAHIEIITKIFLSRGKLLLSNFFIGQPQNDFKENIDFPPYIGNNLNAMLFNLLSELNTSYLFKILKIPHTDPIISTLNTLASFYRGKHVLSSNLKSELETNLFLNFKNISLKTISNYKFYIELLKFAISYFYYIIYKILFNKKVTNLK